MHIVQRWLQRYTDVTLSPEEITERLTMIGLEFESVNRPGDRYQGFVVGEVLDVQKHPKADRLTVCRVAVGKETLQIVCGAPNVAAGQKVAVGLVGATIPHNQHDPSGKPFVLSKVSLRGVESSGMICSAFELDLGKDAEGIMVLEPDAIVGQTLAEYLGLDDVVYDAEITPNRPDWLSHIGFARELTVVTGKRLKIPTLRLKEGKDPISRFLSVTVKDRVNCPRFAARMIRGVHIGPSPRWLQNWLTLAGLRPINNVVDITNFVMYECGHPMHAFDYALLDKGALVIRAAGKGLRFTTLDGKEHAMPEEAVMVCDGTKAVSVAGVMGGENSEIRPDTVDVVLEGAYWNPASIRKTAKVLGISTDASQRFERGADPNVVPYALNRAAALILELAGGTLLKGMIDVYPKPIRPGRVTLRPSRVNAILGTEIRPSKMVTYLQRLGLRPVKRTAKEITFVVPTFRVDLDREIDLIEEIARVHGYNNIEDKTRSSVDFVQPFLKSAPADRVRTKAVEAGLREVLTNSMQDERRATYGGRTPVKILNPQNQDMINLRTSLIPGMLDVVARNIRASVFDMRLFEIGHVFSMSDPGEKTLVDTFREEERLAVLLTGSAESPHWAHPARTVDFFDMKGCVEGLLEALGLDKWRVISYSTGDGLTEDSLAIEIHGSYAGHFGRVRSEVLKFFGIEQEVFAAEFALTPLCSGEERRFEPLPRFPRVRRDVAFGVREELPAGDIVEVIRASAGELLQSVEVFDVYQGANLPPGTKSLAFTLELLSREGTLTEADIDAVVQRVIHRVQETCGATLRGVKE
jgi:phenylalanyl-tRNA synthetase beta chain